MKLGFLNKIYHALRFNNWWQYKIPPLIAIFLLAKMVSPQQSNAELLNQFLLLFLWMISAASFGYYVNDFSDIEEDNLAGKQNLVQVLDYKYRVLVFFPMGLLPLGFQFLLNGFLSVPFALSVLQLAFFVLYSVRPIRLKERFIAGAACDALYAHLLPALIVFITAAGAVLPAVLVPLLVLLCAWQLLQGLRNILLHHVSDVENDTKSATNNLAARFGAGKLVAGSNYFIAPLELGCFIGFLYLIHVQLLFWAIIAGVIVWVLRFLLTWNKGENFLQKINRFNVSLWLLNSFYEQIVPIVAICFFCFNKNYSLPVTAGLLVTYFLLFPVFVLEFVKGVSVSALNQFAYRTKAVVFDAPKKFVVSTYWKAVTFYWKSYAAYWKRQHEKNPNIRYHFCTVSNVDYLHRVLALHQSLNKQTIKARLHVLVTDGGDFDKSLFPDTIIFYSTRQLVEQPYATTILEKYADDRDKIRWCLKPVFMHYLLDKGIADSVLYVDNDVFFFEPFFNLYDFVGSCGVWLTPHWRCMDPFKDAHVFKDSFKDGMFNAGFVGASRNGKNILEWWAMANSFMCEKNRPEGLWDDQKYLDMLPVRFANVGIVRHMGCNVAVWNKQDCRREAGADGVLINGEFPVVFIHFTNDTMQDIEFDKYGGDPLLKPYLEEYKRSIANAKAVLGG
jgi:4-hydroxybenzoate polyprenyltransferase